MINGVYHLDGLMRGLLQVNIDMMKNIFYPVNCLLRFK